jgi:hypothetical protein
MSDQGQRGFFDLLKSALGDVSSLAQLDAVLLRTELKASLAHAVRSAIFAAVSVLLALIGLCYLGVAAYDALVEFGLRPSLAALTIAAVFLIASGLLAFLTIRRTKTWTITPSRTIAQVQKNFGSIKASLIHGRSSL